MHQPRESKMEDRSEPLATDALHGSPSARPRTAASRRREKPQLSCNACRRRKSRCDRQRPCSNCASRDLGCVYAQGPIDMTALPLPLPLPQATASWPAISEASSSVTLHDRIVQLERLCMSMIPDAASRTGRATNTGNRPGSVADTGPGVSPASHNPSPTVPTSEPSECGSLRIAGSEQCYFVGDHWAAILDSIADLKDHLDRDEQLRMVDNGGDAGVGDRAEESTLLSCRAMLLYGPDRTVSREQILEALQPKSAIDRYVSRYFNRMDLVSGCIHGPRFLREYEEFWRDPTKASILWVGLLYSMICLALLASDPSEDEQQWQQIKLYREKTVQCLLLGQYTKGGQYALEALVNYVYIEFVQHSDADRDLWFLLALEVNLAIRMGYHRDPSHFSGMTPLDGEIRRRVWATVILGDILVSSQMGMPRMISDGKHDTKEPRNLNDSDMDETTLILTPGRPENEFTTSLGVIARSRILTALSSISYLAVSVNSTSYSDVLKADEVLRQAAASIPPPLRMRPMTASVTDTPLVIMSRLFINHMVNKGKMLLHRRFSFSSDASTSVESPQSSHTEPPHFFPYSQTACIDASLDSLMIQHILEDETCPGGQLHTMRWRVTSIMNHDFLTASFLLCSLLMHRQHQDKVSDREEEIVTALRKTRTIWIRRSANSHEAKTAAEAVSFVLARRAAETGGRSTTGMGASRVMGGQNGIPHGFDDYDNDGDVGMSDAAIWEGFLAEFSTGDTSESTGWPNVVQGSNGLILGSPFGISDCTALGGSDTVWTSWQ